METLHEQRIVLFVYGKGNENHFIYLLDMRFGTWNVRSMYRLGHNSGKGSSEVQIRFSVCTGGQVGQRRHCTRQNYSFFYGKGNTVYLFIYNILAGRFDVTRLQRCMLWSSKLDTVYVFGSRWILMVSMKGRERCNYFLKKVINHLPDYTATDRRLFPRIRHSQSSAKRLQVRAVATVLVCLRQYPLGLFSSLEVI